MTSRGAGQAQVKKIAMSQTRYELFEVTHDNSLGREVLSRPLNIDEMQEVVRVYNSHAELIAALEAIYNCGSISEAERIAAVAALSKARGGK